MIQHPCWINIFSLEGGRGGNKNNFFTDLKQFLLSSWWINWENLRNSKRGTMCLFNRLKSWLSTSSYKPTQATLIYQDLENTVNPPLNNILWMFGSEQLSIWIKSWWQGTKWMMAHRSGTINLNRQLLILIFF